ncbi:MAG: tryptophan--tRNA ligase [Deltaproteobacteria bacterium]|nr:tryptophan--tRNA ligase [Deltaproteobacteria bacterium]
MSRKRILSGMQPTGELHLGNYLGALANWVRLQDEYEGFFCIVDQHAITVDYDPRVMPSRVLDMAIAYLAAGIDPTRSVVFVQSAVPEHTELAWYLSTVTQYGELGRMTQFKDKSDQHQDNVNAGLFTYPVLMAADILLYRATHVPVGDDQTQHLELTRNVAHRFNTRFGKPLFALPQPVYSNTPRIMGLDGLRKMSKSLGNHIAMLEEPKPLWKKLASAYTDPQRTVLEEPGRPEICNVYRMHTALTSAEKIPEIERQCREASWGCGHCKKELQSSLEATLGPIRERARALRADVGQVHEILADGNARARREAQSTLEEVRALMGMTGGAK